MKRIAIIGSGNLAQQFTHHIHTDSNNKVIGYFDDFKIKGETVDNLPILGRIDEVISLYNEDLFDEILIGIGYQHPEIKEKIFKNFLSVIAFHTFVHSSCIVDSTAIVESGSVIYPGCIIDQHVVIKNNVTINPGVMVGHNSVIGQHTFIAGSAAFSGFVTIGKKCFIGLNATFVDNIQIKDKVNIAAGAVVTKSIKKSGWYIGSPAKFLKDI